MSAYRIEFANGDAPIVVDGWLSVGPTLGAKLGYRPVIGHSGDLHDGGDRTLVWEHSDIAENDDGARAIAVVRRAGNNAR